MSIGPDLPRSAGGRGPTVGVFMPNRNHAALLPRALDAIRLQTHPADQWLVVDDASTDDSAHILHAYSARHGGCLDTLCHERNLGVIPTFAEVLPGFSTDYLYPAAADDYALPIFFEKALNAAAAHPGVGVIFGEMEVRDPEGRLTSVTRGPWKQPTHLPPAKFYEEFLLRESPLRAFGCSILYRTDALKEMKLERFASLGHGYDNFVWRTIALKYGAYYIPEPLGVWCVQPGSMSQSALKDRALSEAVVTETVRWMRSDEFKSLYPESYVRLWERQYRRFLKFYFNPVLRPAVDTVLGLSRFNVLRPMVQAGEAWARRRMLNLPGKEAVNRAEENS